MLLWQYTEATKQPLTGELNSNHEIGATSFCTTLSWSLQCRKSMPEVCQSKSKKDLPYALYYSSEAILNQLGEVKDPSAPSLNQNAFSCQEQYNKYKTPNRLLFSSLSAHPHEALERGCSAAELSTIVMFPLLPETLTFTSLSTPALLRVRNTLVSNTHMWIKHSVIRPVLKQWVSQEPTNNCFPVNILCIASSVSWMLGLKWCWQREKQMGIHKFFRNSTPHDECLPWDHQDL